MFSLRVSRFAFTFFSQHTLTIQATVLLAVLFMLLPVVLRKFVKMGGPVLKSQIELQLFSRFWLFQVSFNV